MTIDSVHDCLLATAGMDGDEYGQWLAGVDPWPYTPDMEERIALKVEAVGLESILSNEREEYANLVYALNTQLDQAGVPPVSWLPARLAYLIAERDGLLRQRDEAWARELK